MNVQQIVEKSLAGMGFDLLEIERSAGGLLRVTMDVRPQAGTMARELNVDDCERVTRQLQYLLEVEGVDYKRLEVSSAGVDRLLRGDADLERFQGEWVEINLKQAMGATATAIGLAPNRRKFRGILEQVSGSAASNASGRNDAVVTESLAQQWRIVWQDEVKAKPGARVSKKRAEARWHALQFIWDEVKEPRLSPDLNFKGRQTGAPNGLVADVPAVNM